MGDYQTISAFASFVAAFIAAALILGIRERKKTRAKLVRQLKTQFGRPSEKKTSPERYAQIPQYYLHRLRAEQAGDLPGAFHLDDITWNDLDLDRLFARMDAACSAAGEEYLYFLLRSPAMKREDLPFSQDQYGYFENSAHEEERIRLQEILTDLGHAGRYSLYDYIDFTDALGKRGNLSHYIAAAAPFAAFALMFLHTGFGMLALLLVFSINLVTYFREKGKIAPYFQVFHYILRLLGCARALEKQACPAFLDETGRIPELLASFSSFRRGSSLLLGSAAGGADPFGLILEYVRILFHLDLIKFNSMLSQLRGKQKEIDELLTITGRIDACISIASWRATLPFYAEPDFLKADGRTDSSARLKPCQKDVTNTQNAGQNAYNCEALQSGLDYISASKIGGKSADANERPKFNPNDNSGLKDIWLRVKDLYHPLLDAPVPNSIDARRPVLLTGSNASGKSTFLKAAALCALLSQSVGTAPARSYRGCFYRIYTSMALRDSLQDGESYFIVEIKSLRRILEAARGTAFHQNSAGSADHSSPAKGSITENNSCPANGIVTADVSDGGFDGNQFLQDLPPVLCCIDEVLRGTNTVERIAASAEILRCFSRTETLCFAATHDLELTGLLKDVYDNYHFGEEIVDGDVRFSYRLLEGPSTSCNAIALLGSLGYDKAIVEKARARADRFLSQGRW